jgi:hypothetical protein
VYWSQASRFYTQQFLFYNLALIYFFKATESGSRRGILSAMLCVVLAFLTQPPALIIGIVFAVDWVAGLLRRRPIRLGAFGWLTGLAAVALCAAVLAVDVYSDPGDWSKFGDQHYQTPLKMLLGTAYMVTPVVMVFAVLVGVYLLRVRPRLAVYLVAAAVVPPVVFALLSMRSYVGLRYAFVCLFAWLCMAALAADHVYQALRPRLGRATALAPLGIVLVAMLVMDYTYFTSGYHFHPRWRDAFEYVNERRQPGDAVMAAEYLGKYYLQDAEVIHLPRESQELSDLNRPAWIVLEADCVISGHRRPWIDEQLPLKAYFEMHGLGPHGSSINVYRYEPPLP